MFAKKSEQMSLQISYLLLFHFYTSLCLPMSAHSNETTKVVSPVKCPANSLGMEAKIRHIQHHWELKVNDLQNSS